MVLSLRGCFQWLIKVQQLGWDLNYNILLADLKRLFLIPFWRRGTGLGPFPRGEEAAVAAQLLCWSTPPEVRAWLLDPFVCLRFPLVSAVWGFSSPLSIPPLLPGRGFLQVDFSFHQISLKPKLTLRPCRCCSRAQFLQGFFFCSFEDLASPCSSQAESVDWTSWSEMWKLRNVKIAGQTHEFYHTHPWFLGGKDR